MKSPESVGDTSKESARRTNFFYFPSDPPALTHAPSTSPETRKKLDRLMEIAAAARKVC